MNSPVKSVESWTVKNDGRDARLSTPYIVVTKIAVRYPKGTRTPSGKPLGGTFHGATNFGMRTSY